jgi:4-diphosphocytidyl-2-C-methyl-D-erythritol kinase
MATLHLEHAHAKLTRTLAITGTRADGFHLLRSEMVALDLCDDLYIEEGGSGLIVEDAIDWSHNDDDRVALEVPAGEQNLVRKALARLGRDAAVRLVKRIPPGAGLGGGSSDAAAVLRAYGQFDTGIAAELGSDVPFCLQGGRALVTGVGDQLSQLDDEQLGFVIVTPAFGVSTRAVYDEYDRIGAPEGDMTNFLEHAALVVEPRLEDVRRLVAAVSDGHLPTLAGSGSSYFVECAVSDTNELASEISKAFANEGEPVLISPCRSVGRIAT